MACPLQRYHSEKDSIFLYQLFRRAHFSDCAIKEHRNFIGILNSSHPMRDDDHRFLCDQPGYGLLYLCFVFRIDVAGIF